METIIHADIFFFITTIWVIFISAIVVVILWHIAHIMKDLRYISKKFREGTDALSEDLKDLHTVIRAEGATFKHIGKYFKQLFVHRRNSKK